MRINVVGSSGSGKTRLASELAQMLNCPHIELDSLHWGPNWSLVPLDEFRTNVAAIASEDVWVVDGNYRSKIRDILQPKTPMVVWLDYSPSVILWQLLQRSARRVWTQETLWNGNRETLSGQFIAKDSLVWYVIKSYRRHRQQTLESMNEPEYRHIEFVHLRSRNGTEEWLKQF